MMKRSLIVTLLCSLLAFSVYAANFTLTVTPAPSNVACDYGPNTTLPTGTVGTDLTTAGFTHCVLNADFTDNSGIPGGTLASWKMNDPTTWLNQCAGTTVTWKFWFTWNNDNSAGSDAAPAPCNRISFVADGTVPRVLSYTFNPSDIVGGGPGGGSGVQQGLLLMFPICGNYCLNTFQQAAALAMPAAMMWEVTFRLSSDANTQPAGHIFNNQEDIIAGSFDPGFHTAYMDPVFNEANNTSYDNYVSGSKFTTGIHWNFDFANYHTYTWLMTTDGNYQTATAMNACFYIDGVLVPTSAADQSGITNPDNCNHWQNWNKAELQGHDMRQAMFIGDFVSTPPGAVTGDMNHPETIWIKSWREFACVNYVGTGNDCGGTLVYHH